MAVKRSVEGLRQNAQKKRQDALEKAEQGIRQLLKEGKPINFNTVAQTADVSKAFLYKEPEIKERIEQLRQQGNQKKPECKQSASDASKDAIIRTLRERIKRLEDENRGLRRQNEVACTQFLKVRDLEQEIQQLKTENGLLRLKSTHETVTQGQSSLEHLKEKVVKLGVQLNSTLEQLMHETPQGIVETAINSLEEAFAAGQVRNPGGFLNKAISDAWSPNGTQSSSSDREEFNQWWNLAYEKGVVKAATQIDGVQHVLTPDDRWMSLPQMIETFPLEVLRQL